MPWHIEKRKEQYCVIKDTDDSTVKCHPTRQKALAHMKALYASEGRVQSVAEDNRMNFWEKLKALLSAEEIEEVERETPQAVEPLSITTRSVIRQQDGRSLLFSISAVAAENRVGEIDSRDLFDAFVAIARATGKYPKRDMMHLGTLDDAFIVGDIVFMARDENCFVTVTEYNDSELAQAEIAARKREPEKWGDSIAYVPIEGPEFVATEDRKVPVFRFGYCSFVSTLPERLAASRFTRGTVEVKEMKDQDLKVFAELFGDEEKARNWLESHVRDVDRAIEDAGLMTRSAEEEVEEPAEVEEVEVEEVFELDVDDGVMDELVARAAELANTQIASQLEGIENALESLNSQIAVINGAVKKSAEDVERRLEKLERDEEELVEEVMRDMPRSRQVRVSYRPSQQAAAGAEETLEQRAERALERMNTAHYDE